MKEDIVFFLKEKDDESMNKNSTTVFEDEQKKKEKIFKKFMRRKTYDFSQLQKPSNYAEINKYWDYEKNILDIKVLDFSSKSKIIK